MTHQSWALKNYIYVDKLPFPPLEIDHTLIFQDHPSYKISIARVTNAQYNISLRILELPYGLDIKLLAIIQKIIDNINQLKMPLRFIVFIDIILVVEATDVNVINISDIYIKNALHNVTTHLTFIYDKYIFTTKNFGICFHDKYKETAV
jgi:hypothetical protein